MTDANNICAAALAMLPNLTDFSIGEMLLILLGAVVALPLVYLLIAALIDWWNYRRRLKAFFKLWLLIQEERSSRCRCD